MFVSWNAGGLNAHKDEFLCYLDQNTVKPHFICIQETWGNSEILPSIEGYFYVQTFRQDKKGGGSAIYVKEGITFNNIDCEMFKDSGLEVSGIIFKTKNAKLISLFSVYIPPKIKINLEDLNKLTKNKSFIILGDLNGKNTLWGSANIDSRGLLIEIFLENNMIVCLNKGQGTRLNFNGTYSHLDLALCSADLAPGLDCIVIDDTWGSDHFPIQVTFTDSKIIPILLNVKNKFNYEKADWETFGKILEEECTTFPPVENTSDAFDLLVNSFNRAKQISIPIQNGSFKHKYSPWWSKNCSESKKIRKLLKKSFVI